MNMKIPAVIILFLLVVAGCNPSPGDEKSKAAGTTSAAPDPALLIGDWVRTDGGYKIKIFNATADGKLEAGYYNPSPIHVGQAEWQKKEGHLLLLIKLQDINYPGSTYTLQFIPSEDKLAGNYFQAAQGMNFNVEFVRQK
jgi:hypothetical protein